MSQVPACRIRPCAPGDEQALALVGSATFLEALAGLLRGADILEHCERRHSVEVYHTWLTDPHTQIWLAEAEQGEAPVGYLVLGHAELPLADLQPHEVEIKRVYVLHRFQGRGLGRQLMTIARDRALELGHKRLLLGVKKDNYAALAFYAALGYQVIGSRSFRVGFTDCEDLILALQLSGTARAACR